jgi:hypothetical protein
MTEAYADYGRFAGAMCALEKMHAAPQPPLDNVCATVLATGWDGTDPASSSWGLKMSSEEVRSVLQSHGIRGLSLADLHVSQRKRFLMVIDAFVRWAHAQRTAGKPQEAFYHQNMNLPLGTNPGGFLFCCRRTQTQPPSPIDRRLGLTVYASTNVQG